MIKHQQHGQNSEISSIDITVRDRLEKNEDVNSSLAPDTSHYYLSFVQSTFLMRQSIEFLYTPVAFRKPWNIRAGITILLLTKLDNWQSQLSCNNSSGYKGAVRCLAQAASKLGILHLQYKASALTLSLSSDETT